MCYNDRMQKPPLAEILRAQILEDIVGQDHLLGPNGWITRIINSGKPQSVLLWGPPGVGKTSIARLYAKAFSLRFVSQSAVFSGIADIKRIIKETEEQPLFSGTTLLFMDEIHRFNKAQQDAFLPYVERGTIVLVGATTENPSFHLNNALLSRLQVLTLKSLDDEALESLLAKYEALYSPLPVMPEARLFLKQSAQGDGRALYNMIESIMVGSYTEPLSTEQLSALLQRRPVLYDRDGEYHYNLISALHKAVRGSDPDAACYWITRMLQGGEDPLFVARRLIRMATEDIGLADPQALGIAVAAKDSYEMLGSPEGELALVQTVIYLALAPKSNAVYTAYQQASDLATSTAHLPPPKIILNAITPLMKQMQYGRGYQYDHDTPNGFSGQNYFPDEIGKPRPSLYNPVERGFEREMKKRIEYFNRLRDKGI